ncbi:MAG: PA2779 family protein [Gammaproteobacteria bacterium]|nr:PA2779 family protein [Gammaproteobacteria bacterium]
MALRALVCGFLSTALVCATLPARAEMIGSSQILASESRTAQLDRVQAFLARDEVKRQMESLGVDPARAAERVAALTDSELQQLARTIQDQPAGGDGAGLLVVVFLIVILLELLGAIDIFKKI